MSTCFTVEYGVYYRVVLQNGREVVLEFTAPNFAMSHENYSVTGRWEDCYKCRIVGAARDGERGAAEENYLCYINELYSISDKSTYMNLRLEPVHDKDQIFYVSKIYFHGELIFYDKTFYERTRAAPAPK